jgi:hypothetical protein
VAAACWPLTGRPARGRAGDTISRQGRYQIGHRRRVFAQRQLADSARLRLTDGIRLRPGLAVRSCGAGQAPGQAARHHTGDRGTDQKRADVAVLAATVKEHFDGLTDDLGQLAGQVPLALAGAGATQALADATGAAC